MVFLLRIGSDNWQTAGSEKKWKKMRKRSRDKKPACYRRAFLVKWRGGGQQCLGRKGEKKVGGATNGMHASVPRRLLRLCRRQELLYRKCSHTPWHLTTSSRLFALQTVRAPLQSNQTSPTNFNVSTAETNATWSSRFTQPGLSKQKKARAGVVDAVYPSVHKAGLSDMFFCTGPMTRGDGQGFCPLPNIFCMYTHSTYDSRLPAFLAWALKHACLLMTE